MKAAYINQTGTHEVITYGDLPTPKPTRRQCLIKVAAVDVNPIDVYVRSGAIPVKLSFPFILGRDLAGTVVEVGASVKDFKVGDRVWATSQGADGRPGTFAEFAAVDHRWLHPIPEGVSDDDAVALSLVGVTAQLGLVRNANLKAGEILFVNGGSGGVGSCVVQMAKILGARVITTAGTDEKVAACRDLGADLAINYKTQDVAAAIKGFAPDGRQRLVGDPARAGFRPNRRPAGAAGPDDHHGRTRRPPALPGRPLLREGLLAARACDVQRQRPRTAHRGQCHQPLAGGRQTASPH